MTAVERLAREREARDWVSDWISQRNDEWIAVVTRLLAVLDEECQSALRAGRNDVFGNIAKLRPHWDQLIDDFVELPRADAAFRDSLFAATLDRMVADGDLLFVSDRQRARSRFFEMIHYMRHLRQRTNKHSRPGEAPELVEMVKAEVTERERPKRQVLHAELFSEIAKFSEDLGDIVAPAWASDVILSEAAEWARRVFEDFVARAFNGITFAEFQLSATREILRAVLTEPGEVSGVAVGAGTGFGKTEAFLLPLLYHALVYKAVRVARGRQGVSGILVYPRRDLCNDQAARLVSYLLHLNRAMGKSWAEQFGDAPFEPLKVALAHGGMGAKLDVACPLCALERPFAQSQGNWSVDDERRARLFAEPEQQQRDLRDLFRCERAGARHDEAARCIVYQVSGSGDFADIVITNLDTLHRRLMDRHGRERLFAPRNLPPRLVVLDEMHIYEGQAGIHAANIVRRLRQRVRAMPEAEGVELVAVGASATVFDPRDLLMRLTGIAAVDIVGVEPTREEREPLGLEYFAFLQSPGNRLQQIGNADDEENPEDGTVSGNQRFVSEQATMIQSAMCLQHTMKAPAGAGIRKRRTLGFVDSLDLAARLARNFDNAEWQDAGPSQTAQSRNMDRVPLYALRLPSGRPDAQARLNTGIAEAAAMVRGAPPPQSNFTPPGQACPRFAARDCRQPPHHLLATCQRYEMGECWYTMGLNGEEGLRPTVTQKHQSGQRSWASPDLQFNGRADDPNAWRLLITTSALEVGFDNPELIATWQYHAPPTVAGFLQRKGRGGRGASDRPITMMVLGASMADVFAFQHHDRYVNVDRARDLVCWIDPDNPALLRQHMVAALFDFCAADGNQNAYSIIALDVLDRVLTRQWADVVRWISDCFGVVPGRIEQLLREFRRALRDIWLRPFIPTDVQWGDAPRDPANLMRALPAGELRARAQMLAGNSVQAVRAREWLQAMAAQKTEFYPTAPDFFAALPSWALPDNDLRLPGSTIAEPLGRDIELYGIDGNNISRDPAEFALNIFLPGGFKIRFKNKLWAAPWEAPPGWRPPEGSQLSFALLSVQEPDQPNASVLADIRAREPRQPLPDFLRNRASLSAERQAELISGLGSETDVVLVSGIKLRDVGGVRNRRFTLDRSVNVVRSSAQNVLPTDRQLLVRDPNLSPQKEILPLRAEEQVGDTLAIPPFASIRHYRRQPLLVLHTSNLVHCYPQDGGERTIAVHFHATDAPARRLAPAVIVRTEALELIPHVVRPSVWQPNVVAQLFWRRVTERLAKLLVVERALLKSFYLVDGCLEALAALEERVGEFDSVPPDAATLNDRCAAAANWLPELQYLAPHLNAVADTLKEAAVFAAGEGRDRAIAETLAAAFVRAGADRLRTSPAAFRTLVERSDSGWRVLVFDDNEGGSGNARRLRQSLETWQDLNRDLAQLFECPVATSDAIVLQVLSGGHRPETLALLRSDGRLEELLSVRPDGMTLRRLERLFEDPDVAAFNLHISAVSERINAAFGTIAPLPRVWRAVSQTAALDPRAEALRRQFRQGPAAELPSRLRAVRPLCVCGCPYCVGLPDNGYIDRRLLEGLAG